MAAAGSLLCCRRTAQLIFFDIVLTDGAARELLEVGCGVRWAYPKVQATPGQSSLGTNRMRTERHGKMETPNW